MTLYDRLLGSWDVESSLAGAAQWTFERALGGGAIQDLLLPRGAPTDQGNLSLRAFDSASGLWRVFFMCPADGEFAHLVGRAEGDDIVQEGTDLVTGRALHWSFTEITPSSFVWRGGEHVMRATRMG